MILFEARSVHPRIRGERSTWSISASIIRGSSPHTRGTQWVRENCQDGRRFIPAYAGNALFVNAIHPATSVHPRIRGERSTATVASETSTGSSPHTRGTHVLGQFAVGVKRFIPACAGNAYQIRFPGRRVAVHPRMCGERLACSKVDRYLAGSSPHVRGTPIAPRAQWRKARFIPACAGNARWTCPAAPWSAVHPRMCGERPEGHEILKHGIGSSPHVRGTHFQ